VKLMRGGWVKMILFRGKEDYHYNTLK
jgi:hypothetical protein